MAKHFTAVNTPMRLADAKQVLAGPLKFGSPEQIAAREFIGKFGEAVRCLEIDGFSHLCDECRGRGIVAAGRNGARKPMTCFGCGGTGACRMTVRYIESLDEDELASILSDMREIGFFEE